MTAFLDWFERHKLGVIGTLATHSFLLFAFSLLTVNSNESGEVSQEMHMDIETIEETDPMLPPINRPELDATQEVTNATSNITAQKTAFSYSPTKMAESVESDLKAFEQQEFDRLAQERHDRGEEVVIPQLDPSKWNKERYMEKAAEPVKMEGATTVWHDLTGRVRSDDVPGYLCKEQGRVAIRIQVDQRGNVVKAEVDPAQSVSADDCMIEHAMTSARRARFNALGSAPDPQRGTLYFLFMPQ